MAAMPVAPAAYPATYTFDPPEKVANWRPLVHWLLAIPPSSFCMCSRHPTVAR
ncbi:MAG: hypothetical protein ACT4OX_07380 [Actinomycetota bacterium]